MHIADWLVLLMYFLLLILIGIWAFNKIKGSSDFFVAGGKMPWWLSGISHHMSGYSGAVFVGYAAIAYNYGFALYIWWAVGLTIAIIVGAYVIVPQWSKLQTRLNIESPTEYMKERYNLPVQQLTAWSGVLLKFFDVGAKFAAIAVLINAFTGIPLIWGAIFSGTISLIYVTVGGIWADAVNDFVQFIVMLVTGLVFFFIVVSKLGGFSEITGMWEQLPSGHGDLFNGPYTLAFFSVYILINFFSYNGGTWNLAAKYISTSSGKNAKKSALLSALLYLTWPLILFFPMWAAPIFLPNIGDAEQSYALLANELMPIGMIGLVLASLFAATLSMTASDSNAISSVIIRDILPVLNKKYKSIDQKTSLNLARISTFGFTLITIIIAIQQERFGGVIGLIIDWFGALVGPVSIPMILGLVPFFRRSGSWAAIIAIIGGLVTFVFVKYGVDVNRTIEVGSPIIVSAILYIGIGLLSGINRVPAKVDNLFEKLKNE